MNAYRYSRESEDFRRIEKAIRFIEENFKARPDLDEMARCVHLSRFHFARMFKRWAGISPIQFMQFMTLNYTKERLSESRSVLDTAFEAGLSGPGRLHDLFVNFEGMTPGEYKKHGRGLKISYGFSETPFGECLLATTSRGICYFGFVDFDKRSETFGQMVGTWPGSEFVEDPAAVLPIVNRIFSLEGQDDSQPFHLQVRGTNFQVHVWKALLSIPEGYVVSYQDIASHIGRPKAYRAVASAIAVNPIAYLIPCHRVINRSGKIHKYRWGSARKKALIGWEAAKTKRS